MRVKPGAVRLTLVIVIFGLFAYLYFVRADTWQRGYLKPGSEALREVNFWVGT